jgi:hypothetical protein
LIDDGLGSGYDMPQCNPPLDEPALDYFDGFTTTEPAAPETSEQPTSSLPGHSSQPAGDADDGGLDAELEAELDKQLFADKPAGEASKSQQADEDSDVETIDEAIGSDGDDARSREDSQQPEDPAQAEQQKQNAWYK